jgi:REP element-mobilizing transposase RayT
MPRLARPHFPHQYYHIFNRGFDQKQIFRRRNDFLRFLSLLEKSREKFDWIIYSYCLLPNHYHLQVQVKDDAASKIIHFLQTSHGVYFNRKYEHSGPVFTSRFKSILIQKELYHLQLSKYIHLNPVKAKLVSRPQDYPYSSYSEYLKRPKHQFRIINKRAMKSIMGSTPTWKAIRLYRSFVEEEKGLEFEYNLQLATRGVAGSDRFRRQFE